MTRLRPTSTGGLAATAAGLAARLLRERGGNVAILFGLLSVPLLGFTGAAIDYGFATRLENKLQAATDATALALCQTPNSTTLAQMQIQANAMMTGYMGAAALLVDPLRMSSNPRQVTLSTHVTYATFFNRILGVNAMRPSATARCATPLPKVFEIALALDNTGSMATASGGQSKMEALKTAATGFVDYVFTNAAFGSGTKISIVPFAASVAVNPQTYRYATWIDQAGLSSYHWNNVASPATAGFTNRFDIFTKLQTAYSAWGWAGCLETLPYPLNVQDGAPSPANRDSYYVPMFAPDEPGAGSSTYQYFASNYDFNSYIDDATTSPLCPALPGGTTYATALGRACKYANPTNVQATSYNAYTGVPNGPNFLCTTRPLQRLTSDTTVLKNLINSMAPLGSTNIHEGLMWGWRTISPNSVFADGAAYSNSTINKILILMTDGFNSWPLNGNSPYSVSQYFANGYIRNADGTGPNGRLPPANQNVSNGTDTRNALDALTATACTNVKATGIRVFTIAFSVPADPIDTQGINLMRNCASSPGDAFVANDSSDLIDAFDRIAKSIGTLRLTQ